MFSISEEEGFVLNDAGRNCYRATNILLKIILAYQKCFHLFMQGNSYIPNITICLHYIPLQPQGLLPHAGGHVPYLQHDFYLKQTSMIISCYINCVSIFRKNKYILLYFVILYKKCCCLYVVVIISIIINSSSNSSIEVVVEVLYLFIKNYL